MRLWIGQHLSLAGKSCLRRNCCCISNSQRTISSKPPDDKYDVIISGGGMVGFAMASSLGQSSRLSGQRILLLEGSPEQAAPDFPKLWKSAEYSNRVCALSNNTQELLTRLGAWQHVMAVRAAPVTNMQVWESESDAHFNLGDGQKTIATIVENSVILEALKRSLPENVEVRYSSRVQEYSLPSSVEEQAEVQLKDGGVLSCKLVIGSDGVSSLVRQAMASQNLAWNYGQSAVVATLTLDTEEGGGGERNTTAWQKFLPTGPIALLPLTETQSSLVWSTSTSHAKALLAMEPREFTDALNNALWSDGKSSQPAWLHDVHRSCTEVIRGIGDLISSSPSAARSSFKQLPAAVVGVGSRASFPLGLGHSVHYVAPRVALVGDAAHRVHPLAGQGVNLGFGDVAALTKALEGAVALGRDVGNTRHLHQYESERQKKNVSMMGAIDGLHRLYTTSLLPVVLLRSLGLTAVDALLPLKNRIEAYAEG